MSQIWRFKCLKCDKETAEGINHGDEILLNVLRHADEIKKLLDSDKSKSLEISIMNIGTELIDFLMQHYGVEHCVVVYSEYGNIKRIDDTEEKFSCNMAKSLKLQFELKEEHLKLIRRMYVSWDDCEFGAPMIDCKRPYGNSDVYKDMAEILGIKGSEDSDGDINFSREQVELMDRLHKETEIALQIILITSRFEPGIYVADEYLSNWQREYRYNEEDERKM